MPRRGSRATWRTRIAHIATGTLDEFYAPLVVDDAALATRDRTRRARDRHPASGSSCARWASAQVQARASRHPIRDGPRGRGVRGRVLRAPGVGPRTRLRRRGLDDSNDAWPGSRDGSRDPRLAAPPRVRADEARRARAVRDRVRSSTGSSRSAGRWRRDATRGTTSPTTSSSSTRIRPSRAPGLPNAADADRRRPPARPRRHLGCSSSCSRSSTRPRSSRWSAAALTFGRIPALFTAALLLVVPGVRDALPPGLERRGVRDRARGVGLAARACACGPRRPGASLRSVRASRCSCSSARRTRCCSRSLSRRSSRYGAWRRRLARHGCVHRRGARAARRLGACTTAFATTSRPSLVAAARGCRSSRSSPADQDDRARERPRVADGWPSSSSRRSCRGTRTRASTSRSTRTSQNGSNYETVRLIALSDEVLGTDENYDVLFDSALEAIREHPGTYVRGVANTLWDFLVQKPFREEVAPREQTAPEPPSPTFEVDGVDAPQPAGDGAPGRRALRVRLVRVRLHRLVHRRGSVAGLGRSGHAGALPRDRRAACARGTPSSRRARA